MIDVFQLEASVGVAQEGHQRLAPPRAVYRVLWVGARWFISSEKAFVRRSLNLPSERQAAGVAGSGECVGASDASRRRGVKIVLRADTRERLSRSRSHTGGCARVAGVTRRSVWSTEASASVHRSFSGEDVMSPFLMK